MIDNEALAYPFLYTTRKNSSQAPDPVRLRDPIANFELTMAVSELGIARPASPILNMPPPEPVKPRRLLDWDELLKMDVDYLRSGDFLVLTTRPPKEDIEEGNRIWVEPGQTDLEYLIFRSVEKYLTVCARSHIKLADLVCENLPEGYGGRANFSMYQSGCHGTYREMNEGRGWVFLDDDRRNKIPAFAVRTDALWEGGPGAIIAFSMDGLSTAAWCWRLRRDFSHLLTQPGFHFYEMTPKALPDRPIDHSWAGSWNIQPVVAMAAAA